MKVAELCKDLRTMHLETGGFQIRMLSPPEDQQTFLTPLSLYLQKTNSTTKKVSQMVAKVMQLKLNKQQVNAHGGWILGNAYSTNN